MSGITTTNNTFSHKAMYYMYMQYAVNELNNAYYYTYCVGTIVVSCRVSCVNIITTSPVESSSDAVYTTNETCCSYTLQE